jgi:uncharacterized membrane protein YedE/YeeE
VKRGTAMASVGLAAGLLFGDKVRGFLDFAGAWDPTLMFVMGGAVAVHFTAYRFIRGRATPVLAESYKIPTRRDVDSKLLAGAALFGLGWGLGGYCPGPAVTSIVSGSPSVVLFVVTMLAASWLTARIQAGLTTFPPRSRPVPLKTADDSLMGEPTARGG